MLKVVTGQGHSRWKSRAASVVFPNVEDESKYFVKSPMPDREMPVGVTVPEYIQAMMGPWAHKTAYVRNQTHTLQKYAPFWMRFHLGGNF